MWIDAYPWLRLLHIGLALSSGALFAARGTCVLAGAAWPMQPATRRLSMLIDSALLLAALAVLAALQGHPLGQPWLHAKLTLLVAYIVLGTLALKRARTTPAKATAFAAALLCFLCMLAIARTHG